MRNLTLRHRKHWKSNPEASEKQNILKTSLQLLRISNLIIRFRQVSKSENMSLRFQKNPKYDHPPHTLQNINLPKKMKYLNHYMNMDM